MTRENMLAIPASSESARRSISSASSSELMAAWAPKAASRVPWGAVIA